jgi:hypothetical protein
MNLVSKFGFLAAMLIAWGQPSNLGASARLITVRSFDVISKDIASEGTMQSTRVTISTTHLFSLTIYIP